MKTVTRSARLSMKTKTNTLLGAVLFLLVIGITALRTQAQGNLVAWGQDYLGQVSGIPAGTFTAIAAGAGHSVAIRSDGSLVAWGHDGSGKVSGPNADGGTFIAVSAGRVHTVAIRT